MIAFWDIAPSVIALIMEALRISETSIYFNEIAMHYIPVGYHLQLAAART
jgi:hypothetical protein